MCQFSRVGSGKKGYLVQYQFLVGYRINEICKVVFCCSFIDNFKIDLVKNFFLMCFFCFIVKIILII